jgi:hypothetical protein
MATAIVGLAVNYSAYEAEIYRAGLGSVPPGQLEAALALGMTRRQALRRVVLPQAARVVAAPHGERPRRALQGHQRLLGDHDRRAHQALLGARR